MARYSQAVGFRVLPNTTSALEAPGKDQGKPNLQRRAVGIFLLDFGQCERDC